MQAPATPLQVQLDKLETAIHTLTGELGPFGIEFQRVSPFEYVIRIPYEEEY